MERPSIESVLVLFAAVTATSSSFAQDARQAIASSDVLSQISMFNYRDGPKSDLFLRGTPIAANAQGSAEVEYQNGNAQIAIKAWNLPELSIARPLHDLRRLGAHSGWSSDQPGRAGIAR